MRWRVMCVVAVATIATGYEAEAKGRGGRGFFSPTRTQAAPVPPTGPRGADRDSPRPGLFVAPAIGAARGSRELATGSVGAVAPAAAIGAGAAAMTRAAEKPREPCATDRLVGQGAGFCSVN